MDVQAEAAQNVASPLEALAILLGRRVWMSSAAGHVGHVHPLRMRNDHVFHAVLRLLVEAANQGL
jgi:hypothetical protein